jgi:vacuolar-type H+-ATPase catalytic subunit A/Vma1
MNKEEAIEHTLSLKKTIQSLEEKDARIRKEFAKAFGWYKEKEPFHGMVKATEELKDISWEEVFIEVGKLLQAAKDKENDLDRISREVSNIIKEVSPNQETYDHYSEGPFFSSQK